MRKMKILNKFHNGVKENFFSTYDIIINRLVNLIWNDKAKIVKPHFSYKKLQVIFCRDRYGTRRNKEDGITLLHTQEH